MDCLFCKIVNREVPADIVYEDDDFLAFRDISPQAPTHVLVIPKKHIATLNDLTNNNVELVGNLVLKAKEIAAKEGIASNGYRLVMNCNNNGGQTVFHIHAHLLGGRFMQWPPG